MFNGGIAGQISIIPIHSPIKCRDHHTNVPHISAAANRNKNVYAEEVGFGRDGVGWICCIMLLSKMVELFNWTGPVLQKRRKWKAWYNNPQPTFNTTDHRGAPTQPPVVNRLRTGASQKRLRDIEDALAEKAASQARPFGNSREQRLREIQNALAALEVASPATPSSTIASTVPKAKRPSESSSPPPTAKRRRLRSSHETAESLSPASILPTAASATVEPSHASLSLNTPEKQPEELYEKVQPQAGPTPRLRDADCHIDEFFARYPRFPYDACDSVTNQFARLCKFFGWQPKEAAFRKTDDARKYWVARRAFNNAMTKQFNSIYGTDFGDLSSWKNLCKVLGIVPIPDGLEECRDAVAATHVNIVDLVEAQTTGKPVQSFSSERELSDYTMEFRKFFPRDNAYAGGLLKFLLRNILNPSNSRGRRYA
ncbi:hypothetical protein M413DRAFT_10279 [Hebeloma cylindrosporum]|uniref:Uncharacterized protein n=1 Tax=Hebeloma cylindrosporum TaxID=76867 RepID=A0A0C3CGV2_HEBCY|nr:hypothetical protein M413DRAFT_10279 [Hebeloma cylindrosporum h7]